MLSRLWMRFFMIGMVMVMLAYLPLAQIHALLDDMESRHLPTRDDLHFIYLTRMCLAARTGDAEAIRDLVEAVAVFERHELTDDTAHADRLLVTARTALNGGNAGD